ncbi:elongator complex protein 3 [Patescibacteria group bacterium]
MDKQTIKNFILEINRADLAKFDSLDLLKRKYMTATGENFVQNAEVKKVYDEMVASDEMKPNFDLEKMFLTKHVRTRSGVAVVAVLTKPFACPGKCLYCPSESDMPKSYLPNEPAVMRAILTGFHPYRQVQARIRSLQLNGHPTDKIELIVMGGTFSYFPLRYQNWFIRECFRAANDFPEKIGARTAATDLETEKTRNEKAENRIVGLTLETRPDYINEEEVVKFRRLGATRVELGVQSTHDGVLEHNRRGHSVEQTVRATRLLKDAGFKINYHLMPGLPGSTEAQDLDVFRAVYTDARFQPDMVKIYPCVVVKNSDLYNLWQRGEYQPLTNERCLELLGEIKGMTPEYVRITRLIRDIPAESIEAGPNISNMRQLLQNAGVKCQCIRCREVKDDYSSDDKVVLDRVEYDASGGREFFLQYVTPDKAKLFALLRLRLPGSEKHFIGALQGSALIREVHTYGRLVGIAQENDRAAQHKGLGRKLMAEAEKTARQKGYKKMAVIAGVGVREYYRELGYELEDEYMVKNI